MAAGVPLSGVVCGDPTVPKRNLSSSVFFQETPIPSLTLVMYKYMFER